VDWDNADVKASSSGAYSPDGDKGTMLVDTFACINTALAAMTTKAGEMTGSFTAGAAVCALQSDESDHPGNLLGGKSHQLSSTRLDKMSTTEDIALAMVAASNACMDRLRTIRAGNGLGDPFKGRLALANVERRRQSVDKIIQWHVGGQILNLRQCCHRFQINLQAAEAGTRSNHMMTFP